MVIDTILFDLDGTLVDSVSQVGEILNRIRMERGGDPLPLSSFRKWISLGASELVSRALDVSPTEIPPLLQEFRDRYSEMPTPDKSLFPGVASTLSTLVASNVQLGVCSNKPEHLCYKVLKETGLVNYFNAIVGGDTVRYSKPHRLPVDYALELIGMPHTKAIFVGDSSIDQRAAKSAEIPFVFFSSGYNDGVDVDSAWASIDTVPQILEIVSTGIITHFKN